MSRPQDPHRPSFPFGNPFRRLLPKGSHLSPKLLAILNAFEQTLADRMRKLMPKEKGDVLSLPWMKLALESLCDIHRDIETLVAELDLPVSDWDEKWIDVYLDISVKLLDICIVFSSEISRLNQGNVLLQCVLHNLESTPKKFERAHSSLDGWRQHIGAKNPRVQSCCSILDSLVGSLDLPKVKNSSKGKVLMQAMYGVKVMTVFVCSVFAVGFSKCPKKLFESSVAETYVWAQAFTELQTNVNKEIRSILSIGGVSVLKELEAVDADVNNLYPMVQDEVEHAQGEAFDNSIIDLRRMVEKFSGGLDLLAKEVDGFFHVVLMGRDALLSNLRASGTESTDQLVGKNGEKLVV